jgi:hypothetical protein
VFQLLLTGSNHHTSFELLHTTPAIKDLAFYSTTHYPLFHQEKIRNFSKSSGWVSKNILSNRVTFKSRNGCDFIFNFTFLSQDKTKRKMTTRNRYFSYIFFCIQECKVTKFQQIAFANIHS